MQHVGDSVFCRVKVGKGAFKYKTRASKPGRKMNTNLQHQSKGDLIQKISSNVWNDGYGMHLTNGTWRTHEGAEVSVQSD